MPKRGFTTEGNLSVVPKTECTFWPDGTGRTKCFRRWGKLLTAGPYAADQNRPCEPIQEMACPGCTTVFLQRRNRRNRASRDAPRPAQRQELTESVNRNQDMFSSEPGHTNLGQHHIITEPGKTVELRPYPLPEARRDAVRTEEKTMLSSRNRTMSGAAP
jgi:hypothetical protein